MIRTRIPMHLPQTLLRNLSAQCQGIPSQTERQIGKSRHRPRGQCTRRTRPAKRTGTHHYFCKHHDATSPPTNRAEIRIRVAETAPRYISSDNSRVQEGPRGTMRSAWPGLAIRACRDMNGNKPCNDRHIKLEVCGGGRWRIMIGTFN